ncbi:zinc-binding dehydrogenase [Paraburkholderia tropica]|uniref:zinc-binding dehydrogenase n=1 Tax=Paraburkholderia tropica TaxID=92647 RepID=UPI002AB7A19D|nr:zinc-binding dehydrogenase [Paraburkholderia tropica]
MRRALVNSLGSPLTFSIESTELPAPSRGEVLLRCEATALGFVDGLIVQGRYQIKPEFPYVPGGEIVGTIEAIGEGVTTLAVGQRIAVWQFGGGLAEFAVAAAKDATVVPGGLAAEVAAAVLVDYLTAYYALNVRGVLRRDETVLVLGAAGGVGQAAIQIAHLQGARVIAVVSSAAKAARASELAVGHVVVHTPDSITLREQLRTIGVDGSIDVVVDPVGGADFESVFRTLTKGGRHLVIGFAAGAIPTLPVNLALLKSASLVGVDVRYFVNSNPDDALAVTRIIFQHLVDGHLKPPVRQSYALQEAEAAFAALADRERIGKVVVTP